MEPLRQIPKRYAWQFDGHRTPRALKRDLGAVSAPRGKTGGVYAEALPFAVVLQRGGGVSSGTDVSTESSTMKSSFDAGGRVLIVIARGPLRKQVVPPPVL